MLNKYSFTAPAKVAIRYEKIRLRRDLDNNPYTGSPRPEFDAAWSSLIERKCNKLQTTGATKTYSHGSLSYENHFK